MLRRHVDALLRRLEADLLMEHSQFLGRMASAPEEQKAPVVRDYLIARFDACARSAWEVLSYKNGEQHFKGLLEQLISVEIEPLIARFRPLLNAEFPMEVRYYVQSHKSHFLAQAKRCLLEAGPRLEEATGKSTEQPRAKERSALVDGFIERCRSAGYQVTKAQIWRAAGHSSGRQFQYWQAGQDRLPKTTRGATSADDRNFRRILGTEPKAFFQLRRIKSTTL